MSITWGDVITDALVEIGVYAIGDSIAAADSQLAIRKLNRIVDEWSARRVYAYASTFQTYTLAANHQPHLIGPTAAPPDFVTSTVRPVRIASAELILTDQTPATDAPLNIRDRAWWANQRSKGVTSTVPTDLYYEPTFPNGSLYLWPVPSFAYGIRLELEVAQTSIPLLNGNPDPTQTFSAPPAYELGLTLTLAEDLCDAFGRPMPQTLPGRAARVRATIQANNNHSPEISSEDWGTRNSRHGGTFNWTTGLPGK